MASIRKKTRYYLWVLSVLWSVIFYSITPNNLYRYVDYSYMLVKIIGFIHLSCMIIRNVWGFVSYTNYITDNLYIAVFAATPLSWILFRDECVISYLAKKYDNPMYVLGSDPENALDMALFFSDSHQYKLFMKLNTVFFVYSILAVNHRSVHVFDMVIVPAIGWYVFKIYNVENTKKYREQFRPWCQIVMFYLFTAVILQCSQNAFGKSK